MNESQANAAAPAAQAALGALAGDARACCAVLGGIYGWYKFFREEPQPELGDGHAGDRAGDTGRSAESATPASRTGSST